MSSGDSGSKHTQFDERAAREDARREGISHDRIDEYLKFRKLAAAGQARGTWGTEAADLKWPERKRRTCSNGSFESGDFTGWGLSHGYNAGVTTSANWNWYLSNVSVVTSSPGHAIMPSSAGNDPIVGSIIPVVPPGVGSYSAKLGNALASSHAYSMRQDFTVDAATSIFYFRYALVFQSEHPDAAVQPFFLVRVFDSSGQTIRQFLRVADDADTFFQKIEQSETILCRRWSCAAIDLSDHLGQDVTVEFSVTGCSAGGHFGYAYIVGVCKEPDSVHLDIASSWCSNQTVIADGSGSFGELAHFWSIQESDAAWNPIGPEVMSWFDGEAGLFDLSAFWRAQQGSDLVCDKYYRVKLAVKTECQPWQDTVKLIRIECAPNVNAGRDRSMCACTRTILGYPGDPENTYSWSPIDGLSDPNVAQPTLDLGVFADPSIPFPSVYTLTVTGPNGCVSTDTVTIKLLCRPSVEISAKPASLCDPNSIVLTANVCCSDGVTYLWQPGGQTTPTITVKPDGTWYTVQATNQCGTTISPPIKPVPHEILTAPFPPVQCPNVFTPNGDGVNDFYTVLDSSQAMGYVPAYRAVAYRFEVRDRWGALVCLITDSTSTGFANNTIPNWNGVANQNALYSWWQRLWGKKNTYAGSLVSAGTYYYSFQLQACDTGMVEVCYGFVQIFHS